MTAFCGINSKNKLPYLSVLYTYTLQIHMLVKIGNSLLQGHDLRCILDISRGRI